MEYENVIIGQFKEYLERYKDKWLVFVRKDCDEITLNNIKIVKAVTRFDKKYTRKILARFDNVITFLRGRHFIHMVLTFYHDDPEFIFKNMKKGWNKLNTYLRKSVKSRGAEYDYVLIMEPHERDGFPHLHVLIFTSVYLIDQEKLSELWEKYGMGKVVWLKRYWAGRWKTDKPLWYLRKYLKKQWNVEKWDKRLWWFYAYVWYYRKRTVQFSKKILSIRVSKGEWVLVKVCNSEWELRDYIGILIGFSIDIIVIDGKISVQQKIYIK